MRNFGLTNNQLKWIAMVTMTVDHIGMIFFPSNMVWRMIGRLAFPIYAFMIGEGCRHTGSLRRYLLSLAIPGMVCQAAMILATGTMQQNILLTFSVSVGLVILLKQAMQRKSTWAWAGFAAATAAVLFLTHGVQPLFPQVDFRLEYDFAGVMLPVLVYLLPNIAWRLAGAAVCLCAMSSYMWQGQWLSLLALPLLALYNGQRGRWNMKWIFYLYYPVHLSLLWGAYYLFA